MRPSQKGRGARNKSGRKPVGNVVNRVYESAGPEGKVRGTPQQIIDKYLLLARDAQTAGDRVLSESFHQFAEHYVRLLNAAYQQNEERRRDGPPQTADVSGGFNDDFGDGDGDEGGGPHQGHAREDGQGRDHQQPNQGQNGGGERPEQGGGERHERRGERKQRGGGGLETIDSSEGGVSDPVETPENASERRPPAAEADEGEKGEPSADAAPAGEAAAESADGEKPRKRAGDGRRRRRKAPSSDEPEGESAEAAGSDEAHAG